METLVDLMMTAAGVHGDTVALSTHVGLRDRKWTYGRLEQAARAVAHHLREDLGLTPGMPVVTWAPNSPQLVATYFGAMLARVVLVPLDPFSTKEFIARVVDLTGAPVVIVGFPMEDALPARTVRLLDIPFDDTAPFPGDLPEADDVVEVVFTSGTTGFPKGVVLTHRNIVANVESARVLVPQRSFEVLSVLPLSHMLEQTVGLYVPLLLGSTVHYVVSRQPPLLLEAMQRYGITSLVVVPQVLELMMHGIEREVRRLGKTGQWERAHELAPHLPMAMRRRLFYGVHRTLGGHLDFIICGAAPLAPELQAAWERMGIRVIQGYGTSECAPIVAANTYWSRLPGSVGRPVSGVRMQLSAQGEMLVAGANVSRQYWRDPVRTAEAFDEGGWYHTGDLASADADGNLYVTGRREELIVLPNGLNVHPEDVERELRAEPEIGDCVVLSLPDQSGNATVHAALIAAHPEEDGFEAAQHRLAKAVRNADSRLAPHQRVTTFSTWTAGDFPRNTLLKVKRHEVLAVLSTGAGPAMQPYRPPMEGRDTAGLLERLLGQVAHVDPATIEATSDLELDLGLDSLTLVELAVVLEDELGVALEDGDLAAVGTVAELSALLEGRPRETQPRPFPTWSLRPTVGRIRHSLQQLALFPLLNTATHPFVAEGVEHLGATEPPLLLIANHSSHLDTPTILRALPSGIRRKTAVAAAADYFYANRAIGFGVTLVLNAFPFSREGAVRSSLSYCGDLLDRGWSILIYPEGTRSVTGSLGPFRNGIGLLAAELGAPVVPTAVIGNHALLPKGRLLPKRGPVTIRFGPALTVAPSADHIETTRRLEEALEEMLLPAHVSASP
jgi:long-chain acyl-CoA synthetase